MNNPYFLRYIFIALAFAFLIVPASAWTFSGWTGPANGAEVQPGSTVRAGYTLSFSSFESGKTFDPDDSLVMYTDLSNPHWVAVMSEEVNDEPMTTQLVDRQSAQIRLDGWSLSFTRKQFTVDVSLTGTAPALNGSADITLLRLQELDPEATTVHGTLVKKTVRVVVPTTVPTAVPTTEPDEEFVMEITPVPEQTMVTTTTPTKKQTYAPGPDPLMICSMLAGIVFIAGIMRRRT